MRISTGMIYANSVRSIQSQTSSLLHTQQQIASGRRILSPADDPVAAARALVVNQSKDINAQYGVTQENAKSTLGLGDSQLSSAGDLLVRVRELAVQAGNAALSASDRASISTELRARFDELIGIANSTDGSGQYLFSGYQGTNKPFAGSVANGVVYQGDDGQRALRVSSSRNLPVSDSGNDVFMNIKNGNGIFVTGTQEQRSANAAKPTFDGWSSTVAPSALPADTGNIELRFWKNPLATAGFAMGSVDVSPGVSISAGSNDTFSISVNGVLPAKTVTVPAGTIDNTPASIATLQTAIDTALGAGTATVSLNANNNLVVTSTASGAASSIAITDATGIFGTPASVAGSNAGTTFYDLVAPATGNSLFTGAASDTSTVAGQAGFTGHVYTSGSRIGLLGAAPLSTAFDYGANVTISGVAQDGDVFSLNRTNTDLTVASRPVTATINAGNVTDPVKWSNVSNSGNVEVRFWVDSANVLGGGATLTYYDLVDANTGNSLFTGNPSDITTAAGQAGFAGHVYTSGQAVSLSGLAATYNPPSNDFGANFTISGNPVTGDSFTLKNSTDATGNGYFITAPKMTAAANTGSGIVGTGEVLDAAEWNSAANSGKLEVRFWKDTSVTPAVTYYDLVDAKTEKSLFTDTISTSGGTSNTYTHKFTSGDAIPFTGLAPAYGDFGASVTISGTPASGDVFMLGKSTSESIFSTLRRLINALEAPVGTGGNGNTALHNTLGSVINNIGQATDNILRVRAGVGSRLNEIDSLNGVVADMNLQYSATLSNLQDVDYAQAITAMTRNQTELEAAQKSFVSISKLSLFNYV